MKNISTGRTLRTVRRAAWFSFVTAPALAEGADLEEIPPSVSTKKGMKS